MAKYLQGNTPKAELAIQIQQQNRVANRVTGDFQSEIMSVYKKSASEFSKSGSDSFLGGIVDAHGNEMRDTVQRAWVSSGNLAAERLLGAVKCAHGQMYEMKSEHSVFREIFRAFIFGEALSRAVGLSLTTIFAIRQIIQLGQKNGDSVDKMSSKMIKQGEISSKYRAMMIARTEVHTGYNIGRQAASEASDLQLSKEWISANDGRVRDFNNNRFSHKAADGEIVRLDEMFVLTGESMRFPGDPRASASNVIHCRCGTADVLN